MQGLPSANSEGHWGARELNIFNGTYSQPCFLCLGAPETSVLCSAALQHDGGWISPKLSKALNL